MQKVFPILTFAILWIPFTHLARGNPDLEAQLDQLLELNSEPPPRAPLPESSITEPLPAVQPVKPFTSSQIPEPRKAPLASPTPAKTPDKFSELNQRINRLLERLDIPHDSSRKSWTNAPLKKKPARSIKQNSDPSEKTYSLPLESEIPDSNDPRSSNHQFQFYLGFSIPNDTTYSNAAGNHDIEFKSGYELGLSYHLMFEDDSYIGLFVERKSFDTESLAGASSGGTNSLINLGFTLGQDWSLTKSLSVLTQASIGMSSTRYEVTSQNYSAKDLAFHYSFLAGLEFKWNEYWQTSLYYEFDGRSSADRIDYQSFHQIGLETGIGF